jgi:hypothetical protein
VDEHGRAIVQQDAADERQAAQGPGQPRQAGEKKGQQPNQAEAQVPPEGRAEEVGPVNDWVWCEEVGDQRPGLDRREARCRRLCGSGMSRCLVGRSAPGRVAVSAARVWSRSPFLDP